MRAFIKIVTLFYVIVLLISCVDNQQQWLNRYAEIKAAYITDTTNCFKEKLLLTSALVSQRKMTQQGIIKAGEKYESEIQAIKEKIKEEKKRHQIKYREVVDKHTLVYGHQTTPDFERRTKELRMESDYIIERYERQIEEIIGKKLLDGNYIKSNLKLQKINSAIDSIEKATYIRFENSIDSLQQLLNKQNLAFSSLSSSYVEKN